MIGLLAWRTLTDRPRRTAFFLVGFGISVGVMITLLSVGEAVLQQARDKDLVGGGDLVLLPEGVDVEVMKVGGATGMFFGIDNARFVYRQVLSGPRYATWIATVPAPEWPGQAPAPPLAAASPGLAGKLVYVRKLARPGAPPLESQRALASGVIPSLERLVSGAASAPDGRPIDWRDSHADRMWMEPPVDSLYNAMDRFHMPPASQPGLDRWAEWSYFNFTAPHRELQSAPSNTPVQRATDTYGFISLMAAGDLRAGRGAALPQVQLALSGETPRKFQGQFPLAPADISTERVDLRLGPSTRAVFQDGAYRLHLDWESALGAVRGDLVVRPVLDLYYPPFLIHSSERFVSGYTVPAIRATVSGTLAAGSTHLVLDDSPAYHDHNWGTWRNVHWDWGTASTPEYGLFYGRVEHPELRPGRAGAGVFLMLSQARQEERRGGFLGLFRPETIEYTWQAASPLPGHPTRLPRTIDMRAAHEDAADSLGSAAPDRIDVHIEVDGVVSNPPRPGEEGASGEGPLVFLQLRGRYRVRAVIDGRSIDFETPGFAEVFVAAGR
jgi:hypothetical protein